jgi:hypothetical protein
MAHVPATVFPLLVVLGFASPAQAILFDTFLPSHGAGKAIFSPPRQINPADVAVPPGCSAPNKADKHLTFCKD